MKELLFPHIIKVVSTLGIDEEMVDIEYSDNTSYGDFSTNVALMSAKKLNMNPDVLAKKIVAKFKDEMPDFVESVDVAGAGFINFKIKDKYWVEKILDIKWLDRSYGGPTSVMVEYTDPNAFKVFHIGHLMSNAIGESISRLIEYSGASITRVCYPSDIGLHIAKSIWAMRKNTDNIPDESATIQAKTNFLGQMYVDGTKAYVDDESVKKEIDALNGVIYNKSDKEVNTLYEKGKRWSMEHFELLYKKLGTKFDDYIYESDMAPIGLDIVRDGLKKNIFEESEGVIIFKGEKYDLHTRVFVNSMGLPIYEAKDLGLNITKFKKYPKTDQSIIVTGNEQNDYFKVLIKVLSLIDENIGFKTIHIGHGMLRFASGKMSSRKGNVISGEALIDEIKSMVIEKIDSNDSAKRGFGEIEKDEIADMIAIGAIKYTILRQAIGGDIIFDSSKSISFEGDSGPYLQYSAVRAGAILKKVEDTEIGSWHKTILPEKVGHLERLLARFPDIVERAKNEYAPQYVANYLISLSGEFNSFYAKQIIVDPKDPMSPYYVTLTKVFRKVMEEGLWILGIKVPKKM